MNSMRKGGQEEVAAGFYFNSWMGGDSPNENRLLTSLKDVDVGRRGEPRLDRSLNFVSPESDRPLMTFERRGIYDRAILAKLFGDLPRGWTDRKNSLRSLNHRSYVAMAKRRFFFESRDDETWRRMIPYRSAWELLDYVEGATLDRPCFTRCSYCSQSWRGSDRSCGSRGRVSSPSENCG